MSTKRKGRLHNRRRPRMVSWSFSDRFGINHLRKMLDPRHCHHVIVPQWRHVVEHSEVIFHELRCSVVGRCADQIFRGQLANLLCETRCQFDGGAIVRKELRVNLTLDARLRDEADRDGLSDRITLRLLRIRSIARAYETHGRTILKPQHMGLPDPNHANSTVWYIPIEH